MNPAKPEYLDLQPIRTVRGTVLLPGSKSITNRMLLLAALAQGRTTLREVLESDDTRYMLAALDQLGIKTGRPVNSRSRSTAATVRFR